MKKRFKLFWLVVCMLVLLCSCGENNTLSLDNTTAFETVDENDVLIFCTRDEKQYIEFLNNFDSSTYKIIDISANMRTYQNGESYVVTYVKNEDSSAVENISYTYFTFKTRSYEEFKEFYSSLDFDRYEVVDVSIMLHTYLNGESYILTYRTIG